MFCKVVLCTTKLRLPVVVVVDWRHYCPSQSAQHNLPRISIISSMVCGMAMRRVHTVGKDAEYATQPCEHICITTTVFTYTRHSGSWCSCAAFAVRLMPMTACVSPVEAPNGTFSALLSLRRNIELARLARAF